MMSDIDNELEYLRNPWYYDGEIFVDSMIGKSIGFIYIIENLVDNKKYIGRKLFTKSKTRVSNGKKIKSRVESTWMVYYGSNEEINGDVKRLGRENFKRTIIHLCDNKSDLNYLETYHIFASGALLSESYYNRWASFKGNAKYIKIKENPKTC